MLTFIVLPHWSIMPQTLDMISHPVALSWHCMMDGWVRVLHPFNSISAISRQWKEEHERLCAVKRCLGSGRISPPAEFEPVTPWSEVGSANRSAMRTLLWHCMRRHSSIYTDRQKIPFRESSCHPLRLVQFMIRCNGTFVHIKLTFYAKCKLQLAHMPAAYRVTVTQTSNGHRLFLSHL